MVVPGPFGPMHFCGEGHCCPETIAWFLQTIELKSASWLQ
jgi:hypothetical protein